jgi:hypothetical protein
MPKSFIIVDNITVGEKDGYADFLVRLDNPNTEVVTVNYGTFDRTATKSASEYQEQGGSLSFAPGETIKTVRVTVVDDATIEPSQNFGFGLSNPSQNATLPNEPATATIIDNDALPGTPIVTIKDIVVDEIAKEASFVITLDKPSNNLVSMNYGTENGSAVAGEDFVTTSGTLDFLPGETAKTVKAILLDDTTKETSETFNLKLSNLSNAIISDAIGTATINENDAVVSSTTGLDIDGNGTPDALTDGVLLVRKAFGFTGDALTVNAVGVSSKRGRAQDIIDYINDRGDTFDIDGNNKIDALTDGVLVVRYLFGFTGTTLTNNAIGDNASRTPSEIASYLQDVFPTAKSAALWAESSEFEVF